MDIKLIGKQKGEWYDLGLRRILQGIIYAYEVVDEASGKWLFNVQFSEEEGKANVKAITSERTTWLHDQIKRKTDVFLASIEKEKYFHPLGITYLKEGRLHYIRPNNIDEVPKEIRDNFYLTTYEKASPKPSSAFKGKIVVLVDKNNLEKMVHLFMLEKIRPVFPRSTPE
jgi:hypothetical protein